MLKPRIIPCLLLKDNGLVKTVKFRNPSYIGDPINAIKIFNEKQADELILVDIAATKRKKSPSFKMIETIASECFMPVCYGGGVRTIEDIRRILSIGIEKVAISTYCVERPDFITEAADIFGSQSIIVCIDVFKTFWGRNTVVTHSGKQNTGISPVSHAIDIVRKGAGEVMINCVNRDGTMSGYDIELIRSISQKVPVPLIACGGAGNLQHIREVIQEGGASSGAAGSLFVYWGKHRAVLINYPTPEEINRIFEFSSTEQEMQ